jgi:hypothetical protein
MAITQGLTQELHMNRSIIIAACALLMAGSAFAASTTAPAAPAAAAPAIAKVACATDKTKFKPQAELIAKLKLEGLTVSKIKVEKGCYETYAVDAKGKKANAAYNAETFEKLDNAEAGEN